MFYLFKFHKMIVQTQSACQLRLHKEAHTELYWRSWVMLDNYL